MTADVENHVVMARTIAAESTERALHLPAAERASVSTAAGCTYSGSV
jgi:hypothetical protein